MSYPYPKPKQKVDEALPEEIKIYSIDCLEGLKRLDDNSIDSIVTDPPYELGFMNKKWDKTGIAYNVEVWEECLRVLKPGGHLLAFGGSRTYHRMACAIEDAGFEIRDCIMWIYGSGFPKSYNIAKGIESYIRQGSANWTDWKKLEGDKYKQKTGYVKLQAKQGYRKDYSSAQSKDIDITIPEAKQWQGWGTALKPAHEPIVVARKPLSEKNVALNVLKWGTGGINIDGCRIETNNLPKPTIRGSGIHGKGNENPTGWNRDDYNGEYNPNPKGRFPANVILDEEAGKLLDKQSGISKSRKQKINNKGSIWGTGKDETVIRGHDDSGGASRFFYCAKASKKERTINGKVENNHPTVKPLKLMRYLVRLVTPPNGIVLDPFMGSGTTALACIEEGFRCIGFEVNKEYYDIAKKRIEEHCKLRKAEEGYICPTLIRNRNG